MERLYRLAGEPVRRRAGFASGESGSILVVVVLLMVALFALGHGLMLSSRAALLAARAGAHLVERRASADGALLDVVDAGGGAWMDSVEVWGRGGETESESGGVMVTTAWRRLGTEAWLLEASASAHDAFAVTSAILVWAYDPVERLRELSGVVSVGPDGPVSVAGLLMGDSITAPTESGACVPWATRLEEAYPLGSTPAVGFIDAPHLGHIDFAQLMTVPDVDVFGVGTPGPRESVGVCVTDDAWNWGDPEDPDRPCGAHLALRRAAGGLEVEGGTGQGILIVDGDLILRGGAHFYGFMIVAGRLRVLDGAVFTGIAIAYGGLEVGSDAAIRASACWAVRVLAAHRPTLGRPVSLHSARRIGPY